MLCWLLPCNLVNQPQCEYVSSLSSLPQPLTPCPGAGVAMRAWRVDLWTWQGRDRVGRVERVALDTDVHRVSERAGGTSPHSTGARPGAPSPLLFYTAAWLTSNVVLALGVQQSDSVIHMHVSILYQILFPKLGWYRVLSRVPCAIECGGFAYSYLI